MPVPRPPVNDAETAADDDGGDVDRAKRQAKEEHDALQDILNQILPEAFAVVREAGRRVLTDDQAKSLEVHSGGGGVNDISDGVFLTSRAGSSRLQPGRSKHLAHRGLRLSVCREAR